jgi:predicted MPP superfamily phosphohydrolase
MAEISFLLPLVLARDAIGLPLIALLPNTALTLFLPVGNTFIVVASLAMLVEGLRRASTGPRVRTIEVRSAKIPQELDGFKIVQISDLHVSSTIKRDYVEDVVTITNALEPDLIALTGDIADGTVTTIQSDVAPLAQLNPKGRVFYVTGNHEYYWFGQEWIDAMSRLGATPLLNSSQTIETRGKSLIIAGVIDPAAALESPGVRPDTEAAIRGTDPSLYRILLAHHPGIAEKAERAGFDLQLSGHTHGGQFFPWTLVVRKVHKFNLGLFKHGRMHVYVNPGTGTWGPPIRLGTHPEITLLVLRSDA